MRPAIIVAALILLGTAVAAVLLSKGSSARLAAPAPARCISQWNGDRKAARYGAHNFISHGYRQAEILFVDGAGNASRHGRCAVVFPAPSLDPEPVAAAQVHRGDGWLPLSKVDGVDDARLAELQADAIRRSNALLKEDGRLESVS